jgi:ABC-2 type transport system ATP-binding protein
MNNDIAVSVSHVSKNFALPHEKIDSLKGVFTHPFRKRRQIEVQHALKDVSFEIKEGEFFGIVGRNGSGKSTLLKIIASIYQPSTGSIKVNGRLVPFIELGVGFNPELTGRENVFLNGALMGFSKKEITHKYNAIVEFAELEQFMDQKLKNYSSGMQVRLAFSVATILAESDILLIDEVLAVGDADFQRKCFEYFRKLKKDKKTVIFVSHDMDAVREYCDRAVLIDQSKIVFSGSAADVAKKYTKLFLGQAYENGRTVKKTSIPGQQGYKWGAGGVDMVTEPLAKKLYTNEDKAITFAYTINAAPDFSDIIIPGITIKDEQGRPVFGTNTDIAFNYKKKITLDTTTRTMRTEWTFPNIFNQGVYTIEPAVLSGTNRATLQWWDDAISFRVENEKSNPYPVAPEIKISLR